MILIFASPDDNVANLVSSEMERRNVNFGWLKHSDFMGNSILSTQLTDNRKAQVLFKNQLRHSDFEEISAIYVRRRDDIEINQNINSRFANWISSEYENYLRESLEILECPWLPAPLSQIYMLEDNKLKELTIASKLGLKPPNTLVTNCPKAALEFYRNHNGRVISKRYRRGNIILKSGELSYTTSPVSLRDISFFNHIKNSPTLFQEYVPKEKELRVTIVGNKTVAAEIDSQQSHRTRHDWRNYDWKRTPYSHHDLPGEIHNKLISLTKTLGLNYATCDLVITPKGEYIFLEINPAGQYEWIERAIGISITGLICDELISLANTFDKNEMIPKRIEQTNLQRKNQTVAIRDI